MLKAIKDGKKAIGFFAANKIKNGMVVFTHCHSSTVIEAFKIARKQGKRFEVICTETRPLYQGRKTARDCLKLGIPTTMIIDSNVSSYLKNADMVMVGADLITADESFLNKVGTQNVAYGSKRIKIPFYVCADLTKFDPETIYGKPEEIEQRSWDEVWKTRPKKLRIINPGFDLVNRELITSFITQEGFITPGSVVDTIKDKVSWVLYGVSPKYI
jgi:ribose 1,5-bisphosphate isomerase